MLGRELRRLEVFREDEQVFPTVDRGRRVGRGVGRGPALQILLPRQLLMQAMVGDAVAGRVEDNCVRIPLKIVTRPECLPALACAGSLSRMSAARIVPPRDEPRPYRPQRGRRSACGR